MRWLQRILGRSPVSPPGAWPRLDKRAILRRWALPAFVGALGGVGTYAVTVATFPAAPSPTQFRLAMLGSLFAGIVAFLAGAGDSTLRSLAERIEASVRSADGSMAWQEQRRRRSMLGRVRSRWIQGVLEHSIDSVARLELGLELRPELLDGMNGVIAYRLGGEAYRLHPGTPITQVFDDLGRSLLIVGGPGSGKTTLLLELTRALLNEAEEDDGKCPMPAVFNLASWALRRTSLAEWLVEELVREYRIPRRAAQDWMTAGRIIPLLDGLDEVGRVDRHACIKAINDFRRHETFWTLPIVVCSRTTDYESLMLRLQLTGAVEIQPLTRSQITSYLQQAGKPLTGVRAVLRDDHVLWELMTTPLFLSVAALAYANKSEAEIADRRVHLFEVYTETMLRARSRYDPALARRWLGWLASSLRQRDQYRYYPEWIQPDWLPRTEARWVPRGAAAAGGLISLVLSTLLGIPLALMPDGVPNDLPRPLLFPLLVVFSAGAASAAAYDQAIRPPVHVNWSRAGLWGDLRRGLWVGVLAGLPIGLIMLPLALYRGVRGAVQNGLLGWAIFALVLGLAIGLQRRLRVIRDQSTEDGTRMSALGLLAFAARAGLPHGLFIGLLYGAVDAGYHDWQVGLRNGLMVAVVFTVLAGFYSWLAIGGRSYLQHAVLRGLLVRRGLTPWSHRRFLDDATRCVLLYKVGDGYIFIHRLLLEFLAAGYRQQRRPGLR